MKRFRYQPERWGWKNTRDFSTWTLGGIGFILGILGIPPDPIAQIALVASVGMIGVPFVLRAEDKQ